MLDQEHDELLTCAALVDAFATAAAVSTLPELVCLRLLLWCAGGL